MAKVEANAGGADDALMLDPHGFIAETNATHLFFVKNNEVFTSRTVACPEGVTRQTIIDICRENNVVIHAKDCSQATAKGCSQDDPRQVLLFHRSIDGIDLPLQLFLKSCGSIRTFLASAGLQS